MFTGFYQEKEAMEIGGKKLKIHAYIRIKLVLQRKSLIRNIEMRNITFSSKALDSFYLAKNLP